MVGATAPEADEPPKTSTQTPSTLGSSSKGELSVHVRVVPECPSGATSNRITSSGVFGQIEDQTTSCGFCASSIRGSTSSSSKDSQGLEPGRCGSVSDSQTIR